MDFHNPNDWDNQEEQDVVVDPAQTSIEPAAHAELEQCKADVNLWRDQASRVLADFDNYKKRMEKEQASWMQVAQVSVLKDLLTVVDNFERALSSKTESTADLYAGIEMIYKAVLQLLQKYGVKEFTDYTTFDPELHEALMDIESADHQSGQIVQVLEKGFMVKDKVLRPAKVMVAK